MQQSGTNGIPTAMAARKVAPVLTGNTFRPAPYSAVPCSEYRQIKGVSTTATWVDAALGTVLGTAQGIFLFLLKRHLASFRLTCLWHVAPPIYSCSSFACTRANARLSYLNPFHTVLGRRPVTEVKPRSDGGFSPSQWRQGREGGRARRGRGAAGRGRRAAHVVGAEAAASQPAAEVRCMRAMHMHSAPAPARAPAAAPRQRPARACADFECCHAARRFMYWVRRELNHTSCPGFQLAMWTVGWSARSLSLGAL